MSEERKQADGWVLCSDMMPEYYDRVIVCNKYGEVYLGIFEEGLSGCKYWLVYDTEVCCWFAADDIVAWMPLPTPLKMEEKG